MIKAKIAAKPDILLVFDSPSKKWISEGTVTSDGIAALLGRFQQAGIDLPVSLSAVCLSDVMAPKAAHFKEKEPYFRDLLDTYAFNVIVPVGAKAFERVMGYKGIERYFGKVLTSDIYNCKVVPCPNPAQVKYKPEIKEIIGETAELIMKEMESTSVVMQVVKAPVSYTIIDTVEKFQALYKELMSRPVLAFDLETTGFQHNHDEILTAQFTYESHQSALIPTTFYKNADGSNRFWTDAQWAQIVACMVNVFLRKDCIFVGHNIKFDLKFVNYWWKVRIPHHSQIRDTMIMSFLIDENSPNDLKHQACVHTDLGDYEFQLEDWKTAFCKANKIKKGEFSYKYIPFDILTEYALTDTDATFRLYEKFMPMVEAEGQVGVMKMLQRFLYATCKMELRGWPVDVEYAEKYLEELNGKIDEAKAELLELPAIKKAEAILGRRKLEADNAKRKNKLDALKKPFEFNLGSNPQRSVLFFEVMKLPIVKYTKTTNEDGKRVTPSMDKEVMAQWRFDHPKHREILDGLQRYSELCKMRSTYVIGILDKVVNGRIYPSYNVIGAKTGRLSSRNPNFQNLPVRNSEAKNVKRIIKPRAGWVMIGADLSAAEMRWACICSSDPKLIEIFNSGVDIHGAIAKEVFNLDCHANEVKYKYPELRVIAKTIQFLSLYGGGASTLASKVKISPDRSRQILEQVMQEFGLVEQIGTVVDKDGKENPSWGEYDFNKLTDEINAAHRLVELFQFPLEKALRVLAARNKVNALMEAFEITVREAQAILDSYFEKYSGVAAFIESTAQFTRVNGYSLSLLGRKRRVPTIKSADEAVAERGIRQAVNATIQSIASDGLMLCACELEENEFEDEDKHPINMLGPIHDALYFEVQEAYLVQARDLILKYMTAFPEEVDSPIPMVADAEWGYDWAHFTEDFGETLAVAADEYDDEEDEEDEAA